MTEAQKTNEASRSKKIVQTSIIGILANVLLAGFKAVMGKTLNKATLSDVVIDVHSIEDQDRIVAVLDKVSDIIERYQLRFAFGYSLMLLKNPDIPLIHRIPLGFLLYLLPSLPLLRCAEGWYSYLTWHKTCPTRSSKN